MLPSPSVLFELSRSISEAGLILVGSRRLSVDSYPRKLLAEASSVFVRVRVVLLAIVALSVISMVTVRLSPTPAARWSLKNWRAPAKRYGPVIRVLNRVLYGCELGFLSDGRQAVDDGTAGND
jgi:hypothetical protein